VSSGTLIPLSTFMCHLCAQTGIRKLCVKVFLRVRWTDMYDLALVLKFCASSSVMLILDLFYGRMNSPGLST
jgi:hypothetical protein